VTHFLFPPPAALFAAFFVSLSPFCVRYAQEARAYSLTLLLILLSCFFILRFEQYGKPKDWLGFVFFTCLGFYAHYFFIFIAAAQFAYFSIIHRNTSEKLNRFHLGFLLSVLLFAFWFIPVITRGIIFIWQSGYSDTAV